MNFALSKVFFVYPHFRESKLSLQFRQTKKSCHQAGLHLIHSVDPERFELSSKQGIHKLSTSLDGI